jgi:hypothetical protein
MKGKIVPQPSPKSTQGQRKIIGHIEKLIRNEPFTHLLDEVLRLKKMQANSTAHETEKYKKIETELQKLSIQHKKLMETASKFAFHELSSLQSEIAYEYGIDENLFRFLVAKQKNEKDYATRLLKSGDIDTCRVEPTVNKFNLHIPEMYDATNFSFGMSNMLAYPVTLTIHRNSAKRDVLDFIENNWKMIKHQLIQRPEKDTKEKTLRVRSKKRDQRLRDFIWSKQHLSFKIAKPFIDEEFPKNGLTYSDFNDIVSLEKKQRLGNISF